MTGSAMNMNVNQAGGQYAVAEINHFCIRRYFNLIAHADGNDHAVLNHDSAVIDFLCWSKNLPRQENSEQAGPR